ncbi:MAG TPA: sugar ABC transporter permease [Anaerolineales bacterium]|nr:sugar ABC transporter permease [Anaerolineales bacterium]
MTTPRIMRQGRLVPLLYSLPALLFIAVFILYPLVNTAALSLRDRTSERPASVECTPGEPCWGPLENYRDVLTNSEMLIALRNNALWLLLMVPATVGLGLVIALLADRVRYESLVKSVIFMPMAISFIGAGVIWRFMYAIEVGAGEQWALVNAGLDAIGLEPVPFLSTPGINNLALMIVGIWLWAGFCMTILSAAIKALPGEVIEAARVDGATEWQVFWMITFPMILPTVTVVTTTMVIIILKIFDIVFVMTGGNFGTEVIANRMFKLIVTDTGRSMAIAVILLVLTIPVMIFNIHRFRQEEAAR